MGIHFLIYLAYKMKKTYSSLKKRELPNSLFLKKRVLANSLFLKKRELVNSLFFMNEQIF